MRCTALRLHCTYTQLYTLPITVDVDISSAGVVARTSNPTEQNHDRTHNGTLDGPVDDRNTEAFEGDDTWHESGTDQYDGEIAVGSEPPLPLGEISEEPRTSQTQPSNGHPHTTNTDGRNLSFDQDR